MTARRNAGAALGVVLLLASVFGAVVLAGPARAHLTEIAVLQLTEIAEGRYSVVWELRPNAPGAETLEPLFPPHCVADGPVLDCGAKRLVGEVGFEAIGAGQSAAMFKIRRLSGEMQVHIVTPATPVATVRASLSADDWVGVRQVVSAYVQIGVEHILLGVDHLLFVLGLIWIAVGRWALLKTITAFTVAHSVTLAAVAFGWVGVPENFVNATIALSIVFIGVEVLNAQAGRRTLTLQYPFAVSFVFGLLHGFGFANALVALGLPDGAAPLALLAFNVGVEIGQIAFVMVVLALAWAYRVMQVRWPDWAQAGPAYAIGGVGAFWFIERVHVLLGS